MIVRSLHDFYMIIWGRKLTVVIFVLQKWQKSKYASNTSPFYGIQNLDMTNGLLPKMLITLQTRIERTDFYSMAKSFNAGSFFTVTRSIEML